MARRPFPEINSASMADIAFMLLIFFLVATRMESDKGIYQVLPAYTDESNKIPPIKVLHKNLFVINLTNTNSLIVEKKPMQISELRKACVDFLTCMNNNPDDIACPGFETETFEGLGDVQVTKAIISIQNSRNATYEKYIEIQNEITAAYNEVKNRYAIQYYQKSYNALNSKQQGIIREIIPQRISESDLQNEGGK